ncbi:MAG: protein kinase [Myxococcales bacterium]|nr:protein kinase [Myxococcales bacterium]MCB9718947.1 protein kinase [Myxococcales bacterium]
MAEHVETHLKSTAVRIEDSGGEVLGTGIVLPWGEGQTILTCAHMIPGGEAPHELLKVSFAGERRSVKAVWMPPEVGVPSEAPFRRDMAMLTLEAPFDDTAPVPWTSAFPEGGAAVWFHGHRAGQSNTETIRTRVSAWNDEYGCLILQDAPARGTSGGPVCIEDGSSLHLVGMVIARVVDTAARGVVLPAATIRDALPAEHTLALVPELTPTDRPGQIRQKLLAVGRDFPRMFQIERTIGHSQRATVFLAKDLNLDREVAIKVLDPEVEPGERQAFVSDVRVAARFDHPNIVRIHGAMLDEPLPFYVMEFIDGLSLRGVIEETDEVIDVETMASVVRQIGDALAYMHRRGFVHGNVSDGNIVLDRSRPGRLRAVISAFGVTPANESATPPAHRSSRDVREDQFFLGRIAHKMVPQAFPGGGCPPELAQAIMRMVHLDPAQRFGSVAEAMDALEHALRGQDLPAGRVPRSPTERLWTAPEAPGREVVARAQAAYERWRQLPRFFDSFYETLFAKDPEIAARFSPEGRAQQPERLRRALDLVLKFPGQHAGEEPLIKEIAHTHSFHGRHKIPPHLYPPFENALLETASRRDPDFDDRERHAWRAVLGYAFDFMQASYY